MTAATFTRSWPSVSAWGAGLIVAALGAGAIVRPGSEAASVALGAGAVVLGLAALAWGGAVLATGRTLVPRAALGGSLAALVLTAAGNGFGRWIQRPGALIRLPGIIMLVPGSASLRGLLTLVQQQDVDAGQSAMLLVVNIVVALVAGLLFGNLLLPARKNL